MWREKKIILGAEGIVDEAGFVVVEPKFGVVVVPEFGVVVVIVVVVPKLGVVVVKIGVVVVWLPHLSPGSPQIAFSLTQIKRHESNNAAPMGQFKACAIPIQQR